MKKIISNKLYLSFLISDVISDFGDSLYYLALMAYAAKLKDTPLAISIINISETLPILLTVLFGFIADKVFDKVGLIMTSLIIRLTLYLGLSVIMGFEPSLYIIVIASFINFISDTLGQFENGLFYPISNQIVKKEDREETIAFRRMVTSGVAVIAQSAGAILVTIFTFSSLARINALTFLLSFLIILGNKRNIQQFYSRKNNPKTTGKVENKQNNHILEKVFLEVLSAIKNLFKINSIKQVLLFFPLLNGGLAIIIPLVTLSLSETTGLLFINVPTTISLIGICTILGEMFGGFLLLVVKKIKNLSVATILLYELCVVCVLFVSIFTHNITLLLMSILLSSIFVSWLNPKMGAIIFNNIDETKLATTFGGMITYFQLGDVLSKLLFSFLVIRFNSITISFIYIVMLSISIVYVKRQQSLK